MSYMRMGHPLRYFKGETKEYVFLSSGCGKGDPDFMEDYNSKYEDNASFCELIGTFVERATGNEEYAEKIVKILAKKLKIEHKLRKKKLTFEQSLKEMDKLMKVFKKSELYKSVFKEGK